MLRKNFHIILCFLSAVILSAQDNILTLQQTLNISDGLPHNGITSMLEDSKGFLWIGTFDGLNKYDGYNLKVYKNSNEKNILVSNRVRTITEDKNHNLWIGTDEGISIFNYSKERFVTLYSNKSENKIEKGPIVLDIKINRETNYVLCATETDGLLVFKDDYTLINQYSPFKGSYGKKIRLFKIEIIDANNYLLSSSVGLIHFNIKTGEFKHILKDHIAFSTSILKIDESTLVSTNAFGIAFIKYHNNSGTLSFELLNKNLLNYRFKNVEIDANKNLWLGTMNDGLLRIDNVDNLKNNSVYQVETYKPNSEVLRSSCIAITSNEELWYGTFNEGLFKFQIKDNPFKNYNSEMNYSFGIPSNHIANISPLDANRVYLSLNTALGSNQGGLALFNTKEEVFEPLPFIISKSDIQNVGAVHVDSRKDVWIKILGKGLFRVKRNSKKLEKIANESFPDLDKTILRSFTEDNFGNIWMGCSDDVYKITIEKNGAIKKIESLNDHPYFSNKKLSLARCVYKDPDYNFIWLGADLDGLVRITLDANKSLKDCYVNQFVNDKTNRLSISNDFVTSVIRLPNKELWVGTEGGGICKVIDSNKSPKFKSFSQKEGLSHDAVKSILYDDDNNLWISTNVGLNKFNTQELKFIRFSDSDGLPFEDFWFTSSKLENGYLLFSGLDGLCYFKPDDIPNSQMLPKLEFGDIKIYNEIVSPGDTIRKRVIINKRLEDQDEVVLKYNENVFSIQLLSLHYSNPDNHHIKYRLLPANKEWIEVESSQQYAYYNGLQPGKYFFNVMASNTLNEWTKTKTIKIIIEPPFWETKTAYFLYFLLAILLIYFGAVIVLRIQKLNHNLEIEQLEKDKVKEINTAKLRFFSNISHELKTPLTLIKGPVNALYEQCKNNFDIIEKLKIIERQSKKISHLINQVHDFQKAEANALKLNYSRFTFNEFMQELTIDFDFMAKNDNKKLVIVGSDTNIVVSADRDKLEKIFNNIFSNAFKYTSPKDIIQVEFKSDDKDLLISISDTGKGIDKEDLLHVFERFYQSHNYQNTHASGSGIGLSFTKLLVEMHYGYISVESELDKGTTFNLRLPIVKTEIPLDQPKVEEAILSAEKEFRFQSQLELEQTPIDIKEDNSFSDALIFYAEDNLDMRMFVSNVLSKYFRLKVFSNGQECLDAMEDEWPDLLISDVQMPELNGLDLCRTLKSDIKTSHIPIILLTALANIEDRIQGIRDGADAYIQKPFNIQHLMIRAEALLANRKQLRERYQVGIPLTKENNINSRNDNAFLEKLYNLIDENIDNQDLDLKQLTKELYLSRSHFYQKIKALTDQTPFELLKNYRLKRAAEILINQNVSVSEVYVMTGFKNRTHFSKLFKEKFNVTPGQYRNMQYEKLN